MDQYTLWLECFNHDMMESDQLIGEAQCSLLPVFKRGELDFRHAPRLCRATYLSEKRRVGFGVRSTFSPKYSWLVGLLMNTDNTDKTTIPNKACLIIEAPFVYGYHDILFLVPVMYHGHRNFDQVMLSVELFSKLFVFVVTYQ